MTTSVKDIATLLDVPEDQALDMALTILKDQDYLRRQLDHMLNPEEAQQKLMSQDADSGELLFSALAVRLMFASLASVLDDVNAPNCVELTFDKKDLCFGDLFDAHMAGVELKPPCEKIRVIIERGEGKSALTLRDESRASLESVLLTLTKAAETDPDGIVGTFAHNVLTLSPQSFQKRVEAWMLDCFNAEVAADKLERGDRFLEEVLELLQSQNYPQERIPALIDYVYNRPVGSDRLEVGAVMVTLAALCGASGINMHEVADIEIARISTPEMIQKIRAKFATKPKGSALPGG